MADISEKEVKGKGLPATKVGGMRVPAHHEHAETAIQTTTPKTTVTQAVGEGAVQIVPTATQLEERKLAINDLEKDVEKMHNPPPKVPKVKQKDKAHKQPIKQYIQPNRLN